MTRPLSTLGARVRLERMKRSWDVCELERRSGVARTTLYHLEKGHTQRVRSSTLGAIAKAFELPVGDLWEGAEGDDRLGQDVTAPLARSFDEATNPAVAEVARERPEVFE